MAVVYQLSPDNGQTKYDIRDTSIAPIELSTTASHDYAVGEQFYLDTELREATEEIEAEDIISNSNSEVVGTVTEQIKQLSNDKADKSDLGTASAKNAISVVTDSTDLVESGAVENIIGWGNKNKLSFPYKDTTKTLSGITFTVIDQSVSVSGLLGGEASEFYITEKIADDRYAGLILSCGVANTSNVFMRIRIGRHSTGSFIRELKGDNLTIPTLGANEDYYIAIRVEQTTQISPAIVFYPMISKDGGAFEPYHATVDEQKCDNTVIAPVENGTNPTKSYAVGEHFIRNGKFCTVTVAVTTSSRWTLGSNYVEGTIADNLVKQATFSGTTSTLGNLLLDDTGNRIILVAYDRGSHIITLYKATATNTNGHVTTYSGEAVVSTAISGTYYYIDKV